jgi:NAD(P)-dependent dehydrogenase (short-subunit alcohol dehydrogenase family)
VLAPESTSTPGWHGLAASEAEDLEMQRLTAAATPLGRLGDPDETASAALFLASDESSFVNGSELFVDGGAAQV